MRKSFPVILLLHALGLLCAACGGGQDNTDSSATTTATTSSASAAAGSGGAGSTGSTGAGGVGGVQDGYKPPYDPTFAINVPIPAGIQDDPRSSAIVARLKSNTTVYKVIASVHDDVPPIYTVTPQDPLYAVQVGGQPTHFRVPAGTMVGGGADIPLILLDPMHPDHGPFTELRLWQAQIDQATMTLSANGIGLFHYNNDGQLLNPDGTKSLSIPFLGVGTGSGLSYLAGLIRPQEVEQGEIRHALRIAYSACDSSSEYRAPATRTDQPNGCGGPDLGPAGSWMDMGMRLQLDLSVDCAARTVPGKADDSKETRFLRMVCRALQDYGLIVLDGTGGPGSLYFYMEDALTASWTGVIGDELYNSYGYVVRDKDTPDDGLVRSDSDGIPWERLRVLATSVF